MNAPVTMPPRAATAAPGNPPAASGGAAAPGAPQRPNVLSLSIKDQAGLYGAYMPFLTHGGIFVPSNRPFRLGEQVFLVLSLLDRPQKYQIQGTVAWITPVGTPLKTPGVGVHLPDDDNGRALKRAVEELLGKTVESGRPTQTL
ncbi:MAG: pilus assembly protein [Cupriavidus sp.]|uniref:PilZ domain-containing protein n=1 Tax=Cupriavidus pauculus TaxID=82633 RepID=UPI000A87C022|nr:PilZ domain-containing protein [Cupriavidus pauculus]MBU66747.1 pilus assembly protein [Cupriavidus sp.]KAB0605097.1 pilus assembly protein [Cupriavidus pauculus]MBU69619.1 pilus assembly protein [Cupriavidus sp.]MBY4729291.1 PilZ domain-containing protein [Cupriavidus pauculus]MCM3604990.1 PilZ domain-containing protein [Cupriavidus pauculus]